MEIICKTLVVSDSCTDQQQFVYLADQRGLPTGNEKILLPAGNNVRTHGNGSLQQINRTVYTYILIHLQAYRESKGVNVNHGLQIIQ